MRPQRLKARHTENEPLPAVWLDHVPEGNGEPMMGVTEADPEAAKMELIGSQALS